MLGLFVHMSNGASRAYRDSPKAGYCQLSERNFGVHFSKRQADKKRQCQRERFVKRCNKAIYAVAEDFL